jgi:hypothetical protein
MYPFSRKSREIVNSFRAAISSQAFKTTCAPAREVAMTKDAPKTTQSSNEEVPPALTSMNAAMDVDAFRKAAHESIEHSE